MAPQFAVSNYGPKRERPELLAARRGRAGDRPNRRHIAASLIFHFLVLFGIFLLPRSTEPIDVPVPLVTLVLEEGGAAGSAGGSAGGGGGGNGKEASSAPAQTATTESAPDEEPSEEKPSEPTPSPPTPEAVPQPPAPQALAPAPAIVPPPPPKPRPPAVKPRPPAAKPAPRAQEKPVEKPAPQPSQTATAEPPLGPSNGPGAASPTAQPGTAASGTASAGPGGATGVGTGAAGAGRGAFGSGKGPGDDYLDRLRRHLAKYKHYPPEAVKRKEEGTVLLSFILARDGTVLEAAVERSSGFPLIDQAALDMLRNASPVPPLPASFDGDRAHIVMPAGFRIGFFDRLF
jgi:periplasmic protein TonB